MASEEREKRSRLVASLAKTTRTWHSVLEQVRADFKQSSDINEFLRKDKDRPVTVIYKRMVAAYTECMLANGVATRKELEQLWGGLFHDEEVRETVEELLEAEQSYAELSAEADRELQKYEDQVAVANPLSVGDTVPALSLVEAETGEAVPVDKYLKRSKLSLFILVRHFG